MTIPVVIITDTDIRTYEKLTEKIEENKGKEKLVKEVLDTEEITEVVSAWTGIPLNKLIEGETITHAQMNQMFIENGYTMFEEEVRIQYQTMYQHFKDNV